MANSKAKASVTTKTLLDLIQDPMRIEFDTPEAMVKMGVPAKGWVQVIDGVDSLEYLALQIELFSSADENGNVAVTSKEEQLRLNAKLAAALVVDWDVNYFGQFDKDNLLKVLSTPRFFFVQAAINQHNEERQAFFAEA